MIEPGWLRSGDDRLHSVLIKGHVWHPNEPAYGDVRRHGVYSFRDAIRSREEVVEHQGYRSQFGKVVNLDYGDPELLEKFRKIMPET